MFRWLIRSAIIRVFRLNEIRPIDEKPRQKASSVTALFSHPTAIFFMLRD